MATIVADDVADVMNSTRAAEGRLRITDLTSDDQYSVALPHIMDRRHIRFDVGDAINFNVLTEKSENAAWVGMFDVDNVNQVDGQQIGTVPWRFVKNGWTADINQFAMNADPAKIVDFKAMKRQQMLRDWYDTWEESFWSAPTSSTDYTSPYGLYYWMVYNATEGFNGGNNSNFSSGPAGLSRSTYARWKNYTFNYSNVTQTDFVDKVETAMVYCNFRPLPASHTQGYGTGTPRWGLYTLYDPVIKDCKAILRANNDSLGMMDLDPIGQVRIGRQPLEWVPYLQNNESTADPIFGINWDQVGFVFLRTRYMVETPVHKAPLQRNVVQQFVDCTGNWVWTDCRSCFGGAKSDWGAY